MTKSYKLYADVDVYPYEIEVYNPRSDDLKPDWLTDLLKYDSIDETGIIYCSSVDDKGGITYPIPKINGHIYVPADSVLVRDKNSGRVFTLRSNIIDELYREKVGFFDKVRKIWISLVQVVFY